VVEYIEHNHTAAEAARILADIDHQIAAAPSFPGLRHFNEGRRFKQWMGNDSKALMKVSDSYLIVLRHLISFSQVFLPAIVGYVPDQMVSALHQFLEFCYYARRPVMTQTHCKLSAPHCPSSIRNVKYFWIWTSVPISCFQGNIHWITTSRVSRCLVLSMVCTHQLQNQNISKP
jgi:hypothetical protein